MAKVVKKPTYIRMVVMSISLKNFMQKLSQYLFSRIDLTATGDLGMCILN